MSYPLLALITCSEMLMSIFCSKDPSYPTQLGNVSFQVTIPDTTTGSYTFVAAVPHLVGVCRTSQNNKKIDANGDYRSRGTQESTTSRKLLTLCATSEIGILLSRPCEMTTSRYL